MKKFFLSFMLCSLFVTSFAQTPITIYTRWGQSVQGHINTEMTSSEINSLNAQYTSLYPQATLLGNSSSTYNCHSYAWNMWDQGGPTCWINASISASNDNIKKYWTNDYYALTNNSNAPLIFYPSGDHSAVKSSVSGKYESKWGSAPLMRHAPDYGPYTNMANRQYYAVIFVTGFITGEDMPKLNVPYGYSSPSPGVSPVYYVWRVDSPHDDPSYYDLISSSSYATITYYKQTIFEVYCDVYNSNNNQHVGSFWIEPIAGY